MRLQLRRRQYRPAERPAALREARDCHRKAREKQAAGHDADATTYLRWAAEYEQIAAALRQRRKAERKRR